MKHFNINRKDPLLNLVFEYETHSQKGSVGYYELKDFSNIISFYQNSSQTDKALEVVNNALEQHRFSAELYFKKAELYVNIKLYTIAFENIQKACYLAPNELEILLLKAEISALLGAHNDALHTLESLKHSKNAVDLSSIAFSEALIYELKEDYKSMFVSLQKCITKNPAHKLALDKLWICVEMIGNFQESIDFLKKLLNINPFHAQAWYNLGHSYICNEELKEAVEAFEYSFLINPKFEFAYRDCAAVCIDLKWYKKALTCYEEVLTIIPPDEDLLYNIGYCYLNLEKTEIAKTFFRNVIGKNKNADEAYFNLGSCYFHEGNWKKAIQYILQAIEIDDYNEEYYLMLGKSYAQLNNIESAKLYFTKACDTAPESSKFWIQHISYLLQINNIAEAYETLQEAESHSFGVELTYTRFCVLLELGQKKEAFNQLVLALTENYSLHKIIYKINPNFYFDKKIMHLVDRFEVNL